MRLAAKLIAATVVCLVALITTKAHLSIHRDVDVFKSDLRREANQFSQSLKVLVEDVCRNSRQLRAMQLISDANLAEPQIEVRWVEFGGTGPTDRPSVSPA